ncbi:MAG: YfiR family protein [Alphaproteobacteria bacterium]|nr:YfiR family protein [Alphaproteobacteria bacterium]
MRSRFRLLMLAMGACLCLLSTSVQSAERRYKVEAALLYSFFNYITWPGYDTPQALHDPVICVYGQDPILGYLDYVRLKIASERKLSVRTVLDNEGLAGCHILFLRHRLPYRLMESLPRETLTVFKPDDPLDRGGMIELAQDMERIAIRVNQSQLERQGFQTSSRLLELAQKVR